MHFFKKYFLSIILVFSCLAIHLFCKNADWVENYYVAKFYPSISLFFRSLFGWLPFSFGDFIWGAAIVYLVIKLFQLIRLIFSVRRRQKFKQHYSKHINSFVIFWSALYIVFNIFWGINYHRKGIASQLDLTIDKYSVVDLKNMNLILIQRINQSKQKIVNNNIGYPTDKILFYNSVKAYQLVAKEYPFLTYQKPSIKSSLWGWVGNYTGFLGYYNPITGEAQVNTSVPKFTQPFTTCHEIAHQLGYAKEMEANFVGYLAASRSTEEIFKYSVYTELFTYANRTLYIADSSTALSYRKLLIPEVINDFKERRKFNLAHTSFLEPIVSNLYGFFLKSNQQPMGILSYDEVTAFIIAYHKKFGKI